MEEQQNNLLNRLLEQPIVLVIAGTILGLYLIGTLEERHEKKEAKEDAQASAKPPPFVSEDEQELWEKFREFYRSEVSNPEKDVNERIDLLNENVSRLQNHIQELLDRTEPNIPDEKDKENASQQSKA